MLCHVSRFRHKLIDAVAENRKGSQRGNRHDQATDRRYESLVDAFRQVACSGRTLCYRYALERKDHAGDGPQQAHHRGNVADNREILDLPEQAGRLFGGGILNRLFDGRPPSFNFRDTVQQDER